MGVGLVQSVSNVMVRDFWNGEVRVFWSSKGSDIQEMRERNFREWGKVDFEGVRVDLR